MYITNKLIKMSDIKLSFNEHGKGRVRIEKVRRNPNGVQEVIQMDVQVNLSCILFQNILILIIGIDSSSGRYYDGFIYSW